MGSDAALIDGQLHHGRLGRVPRSAGYCHDGGSSGRADVSIIAAAATFTLSLGVGAALGTVIETMFN